MRHRMWPLLLILLLLLAGMDALVDRSALLHAERHLLAMFGLDVRPRPQPNSTISDYMKNLYETQRKSIVPYTIRSFKGRDIGLSGNCDSHRAKYHFNLSGIEESEHVWAAELVLYKSAELFQGRPTVHRVQVFDVVHPSSPTSDSIHRLLDTRIFKGSNTSSWENFDVLPAVKRWLSKPVKNNGLHIELATTQNKTQFPSVRLKRSIDEDHHRWSRYEPILVTYSRDPNAKPVSLSRTKRSGRKHRRKGRRDNCRRHALYVDFSDVGWNDWIIAPPGYNAYFCHGDCPFPLPDHLNATNHAIVQTLVNSANPAAVPRACCIPTELSPISMLYKDKYDNVVLKNYQDMVVEGCGCR